MWYIVIFTFPLSSCDRFCVLIFYSFTFYLYWEVREMNEKASVSKSNSPTMFEGNVGILAFLLECEI